MWIAGIAKECDGHNRSEAEMAIGKPPLQAERRRAADF
jgi:hypothetical protein